MEATKSETNIKQAVPFFAVSNMEDSLRFYVDGLGFEMTHKWIDEGTVRWCMLQREGAALMLVPKQHFSQGAVVPKFSRSLFWFWVVMEHGLCSRIPYAPFKG